MRLCNAELCRETKRAFAESGNTRVAILCRAMGLVLLATVACSSESREPFANQSCNTPPCGPGGIVAGQGRGMMDAGTIVGPGAAVDAGALGALGCTRDSQTGVTT